MTGAKITPKAAQPLCDVVVHWQRVNGAGDSDTLLIAIPPHEARLEAIRVKRARGKAGRAFVVTHGAPTRVHEVVIDDETGRVTWSLLPGMPSHRELDRCRPLRLLQFPKAVSA